MMRVRVRVRSAAVRWLLLSLAACGGSDAASVDAAPDVPADAGSCFGAAMVKTCLPALPASQLALDGMLDTGTDTRCFVDQGWCVLAGTDVQVGVLRVVGTRPLVLVATSAITVNALDAASRLTGNVLARGPGADSSTCIPAQTPSQGVGGPGGTFGGRGGDGGVGCRLHHCDGEGSTPAS